MNFINYNRKKNMFKQRLTHIRCPNMDILQLVDRRVCLVSEFEIFLIQLFLYTPILDR